MVAREGFRYAALLQQRHTKYGRIRGMVVGEGGRSTGVLLYRNFWSWKLYFACEKYCLADIFFNRKNIIGVALERSKPTGFFI